MMHFLSIISLTAARDPLSVDFYNGADSLEEEFKQIRDSEANKDTKFDGLDDQEDSDANDEPPNFLRPKLNESYPYNCKIVERVDRDSLTEPTDVSELTPDSVKLVYALGDSISAGFGAFGYPVEYRYAAFSGGQGDDMTPTMPWYLKHHSPNLRGASFGTILPETPSFRTYYALSNIKENAALTSSVIQDVLDLQIPYIEDQDYSIVAQDGWKVVTLFIGANNIWE